MIFRAISSAFDMAATGRLCVFRMFWMRSTRASIQLTARAQQCFVFDTLGEASARSKKEKPYSDNTAPSASISLLLPSGVVLLEYYSGWTE